MSNHAVVVKLVENVSKHNNADKLEIITLENIGYTIISQTGNYEVGDLAVMFPEDSLLSHEMVDYFELGFLKNRRVTVAKIRGIYSQALILPMKKVCEFNHLFSMEWVEAINMTMIGKTPYDIDFSKVLGVRRQEKEVVSIGKKAGGLPQGVEKYDLENVERYPEMFDTLFEEEVLITEKLEGTNFTVHAIVEDKPEENYPIKVTFCSRTLSKSGGIYQDVPVKFELHRKASEIMISEEAKSVTIRGEIIGTKIQGNIYRLENKMCVAFDIMIDGRYVHGKKFLELCERFDILYVPVVYSGLLRDYVSEVGELKRMSTFISFLGEGNLAEGIVVKNLNGFDRTIFKQRSPEYLGSK